MMTHQDNDKLWSTLLILALGTLSANHSLALNDPMRPPFLGHANSHNQTSTKKTTPKSIQLSTIVYAQDRQTAVLNGQATTIGDHIAGYQVFQIQPNRVVLRRNGLTKELHLFDPALQTTTISSPHNTAIETIKN